MLPSKRNHAKVRVWTSRTSDNFEGSFASCAETLFSLVSDPVERQQLLARMQKYHQTATATKEKHSE